MKSEEPIVLGKVKKGSAGKPIVVIILFLFIGAIILFLPTIQNYFGDNNMLELIKNGEIIDFFINHDNYMYKEIKPNINKEDKDIKELLINSKSVLYGEKFTLDNFNLSTDKISFDINVDSEINFDEENYYLVLSQNNKEVTIKLIGNISNTKEQIFKFKERFSNTVNIKGIIKSIKESEYPSFVVTSDESGFGSLICSKENYRIEYIMSNNNLIRIKENLTYLDNGSDYLSQFEKYSKVVTSLNNSNQSATIIENYSGFVFSSDIDLLTYNNSAINYNYYSLNTRTNKIKFEMNAKGYDCK